MTDPQTFQEFLEERLRVFDPTVDLTSGSPAQVQIIQPTLDFVGSDPFSMPALDFIMARVSQEYPSLDAGQYSALRDIMAKPHVPIVNAFRTQVDTIRKNQSLQNPQSLADVEANALAANWFTTRREGEYVTTPVRVYYSAPKYVTVTTSHRFYTNTGLNFYPPYPQAITAEQMTSQRSGNLYYADFIIRAEEAGGQYAVNAGDISNVSGLPSATRVSNLVKVTGGTARENSIELINRTRSSITERSLVSARAIYARLMDVFSGIRNLEVVGFGDPEMYRDIITGGGYGAVKVSGTAFVFGTFCMLLSQYEDRGRYGNEAVQVGDLIDLNYWPLLYGMPAHQQHEIFTVTSIVFSSRSAAPSVPTVYLFQMNGEPSPTSTILGGFPGLLPAVFANVTGPGKIEISDIPGGILQPNTDRGTIIVNDGEVHIGGKFDIWVRPQSDSPGSLSVSAYDEEPLFAARSLSIDGLGSYPNVVGSTDPTVDFLALGGRPGHHLVILDGADAGSYGILRVTRDEMVIDTDLTTTDDGLAFRIVAEVVVDLVEAKRLKIPFGEDAPGDDLQTFVGSDTVRLGTNLLSYLVEVGDTLRILEGPDAGDYEIQSFDTLWGGAGPQLDRMLSGSNAQLSYQVFTGYGGVNLPLVRIEPAGAVLLDAANQPTDVTVPPALPVDGRNPEGFTGATPLGDGDLGFVMPDLTPTFEPLEDVVCSRLRLFGLDEQLAASKAGTAGWPATTEGVIDYLNEVVGAGCYGEGCIPCDGYVVCLSFDTDAIRLNTSLTPGVAAYWNTIIQWFTDTFNAFFPSQPVVDIEMDEDGIVIPWPTPMSSESTSLMQVELCLPAEFFNCCNDVFVALPEMNIETLAGLLASVTPANWPSKLAEMGAFLDATSPSPLCAAEAGDLLTVTAGPNAGGYSIKDVHEFHFQIPIEELTASEVDAVLLNGGGVSAANYLAYLNRFWGEFTICAVAIRGEFAVGPCGAFWNLFQEGLPDVPDLPEPPAFDGYCYDDYGNFQDPFDWVVAFFAWLIEFLGRLGLDIPEDILDYFGLENILLALSDMVFVGYTVGKPTCCNVVRLYFTEPTSIEVDSGGDCVVVFAEEEGDVPVTFYAGQPTLFQVIAGAEELLYAPCHDAPPHQVYPSKEEQDDTLEKDLPRHIEVVEYGTSTEMQITDVSVPAPIVLGLLEGRDYLELHEETFALPSKIPVDTAAQVTSDAISFPFTVDSPAVAVVFSQSLGPGAIPVNGQTLRVTVVDANGTHVQEHTFPPTTIYPTAGSLVAAIAADVGFLADGPTSVLTVTNGGLLDPGGLNSLHIRTVLPGSTSSIQVDLTCTAVTAGVLPWDVAHATDTGKSGSEFKATIVDPTGTHAQSRKIPADTYTSITQLAAALNNPAFTDVGGVPVLVVSALSGAIVLTSVQVGSGVSITVDAAATIITQGFMTWTILEGWGLDAVKSKERIPALRTWRNKATVEVLSTSGVDFVTLNVQEGDLLFIGEGIDAGGYVIGEVDELSLVLDRPLLDNSATPVKQGNSGSWNGFSADPDNKRLTVPAGTFNTNDIGRYVTVYGSHHPEVNGSYRVDNVDTYNGAWVELDVTFPSSKSEMGVLWVLTAAPAEDPEASDAGGTELWGLRPFRIYHGTAGVWIVSAVDTALDASAAAFFVQDPDDSTHLPTDGQDQPFRIVRPGIQRVSSTVMAAQREGSLYYADFLVYGLGSEKIYNVAGDTRFEAVFGTYKSDGYRYETEDNRFSFSVFERVKLHMTPSLLPPGSDDDYSSRFPIDGQRLEFRYTWAPLVAQLQRFVTSVQQRTVNADPLVRHFLPSYVALDVHYYNGAMPSKVYTDAADYLNGLNPQDAITISAVEALLKNAGATDWAHPDTIVTVTHDLDRRMVGDRSPDRLGGDAEVPFFGSNRTSYFIAGSDASGMDSEEIELPGEKLILTRETGLVGGR